MMLYNTARPHSSLGNLPPAHFAQLSAPASQRAEQAQMTNRLYSSLDDKRGSGQQYDRPKIGVHSRRFVGHLRPKFHHSYSWWQAIKKTVVQRRIQFSGDTRWQHGLQPACA
jgi:hypothetical protein